MINLIKKFTNYLNQKIRRWACYKQFNKLSKPERDFIRWLGEDPESLIEKGQL